MFQVIKRDGSKTAFCLDKISGAIIKAFNATQMQFDQDMIDLLVLRVTADFQSKIKDGSVHVDAEVIIFWSSLVEFWGSLKYTLIICK